jgi:hypothetical protein
VSLTAEETGTRFHQASVLTFENLDVDDPAVDTIELEVPSVTGDAPRDGHRLRIESTGWRSIPSKEPPWP